MARKKEPPVPSPCHCGGGAPVVVKSKSGGWGCVCLLCGLAVFHHPTEVDAVNAYNEEVAKKNDTIRKRH